MGCNKCKKEFPGGFGKKDYSGFDRQHWNPRNNEEHRQQMLEIQGCFSKSEKEKLESKYGTRFLHLNSFLMPLTIVRFIYIGGILKSFYAMIVP